MDLKRESAQRALDLVEDGMRLGLGTGSTTAIFIELLGERVKAGGLRNLQVVPTSEATARRAAELGLPLRRLSDLLELDLAVDGADEVDPQLNLIKGLGKALLREKLVEIYARRLVIIVDESKLVGRLGCRGPLPVEVLPFEWAASVHWLESLGCRAELWCDDSGQPYVTDNGNYLARCWFENAADQLTGIPDIHALAEALANRPGIIEHGLFLGMANLVIVAGAQGMRTLERTGTPGEEGGV